MALESDTRVVITDLSIPFASLVVLLVKWALAAIPALLIVLVVVRVFRWFVHVLIGA
jgi:hypothetical protein